MEKLNKAQLATLVVSIIFLLGLSVLIVLDQSGAESAGLQDNVQPDTGGAGIDSAVTISTAPTTILFCGDEQEGFEIYLADTDSIAADIEFQYAEIRGSRDDPKLEAEDKNVRSLVIPYSEGEPVLSAISEHHIDVEPERYVLGGAFTAGYYLSWYLHGRGSTPAGRKEPPYYIIQRDGSGVRVALNLESRNAAPVPESLGSKDVYQPCRVVDDVDPAEFLGNRLQQHVDFLEDVFAKKRQEVQSVESRQEF